MIKSLTENQANKLLHQVRHRHSTPATQRRATRDYLLLSLMLDAGLRVGEVVSLKISDLYAFAAPKPTLNVRASTTKTNHDRTVPLTERIQFATRDHLRNNAQQHNAQATPWIFPTIHSHHHITTRQVQRIVQRAGEFYLNIDLHPHMLRHTFATRLMRTTSIAIVQHLLGHRRLTSTQIYLHPNNLDLKSAIDRLNNPKQNPK